MIDDKNHFTMQSLGFLYLINGSSSTCGKALELVDRKNNTTGAGGVHQEHEKDGSGLAVAVSITTTTTAATIAAAAADSHLDRYDDDDDDDKEAQTNDGDALLESGPGNKSTGGEVDGAGGAERARDKAGVLMAIRIMLGTDESASFFMAVVLSGMGSGVIDTFLFIR